MKLQQESGIRQREGSMTKEELVETLRKFLKTEADLMFLLKLDLKELETLVATIRDRVDKAAG
jgi:glycerol-3-phosphate responsive antiterminator